MPGGYLPEQVESCHPQTLSLAQVSPALSPTPPGTEAMASKPEKRVASSVFITLSPPRRDAAVVEQVRRVACEAPPGHPQEPPAPMRAPGVGSAGKPSRWAPPGKPAAAVPAVTPLLSNGGKWIGGQHQAAPRWGGKGRL